MKQLLILAFVWISFQACKPTSTATPRLFDLMENTGIQFSNKVTDTRDFNIFSYRNFYNGAGVAIGDINNDGLSDIFFTANLGPNKLYLNKGNFQFEDISAKAGFGNKKNWSTGVVMADVNHDGWLDIYVCNAGYQDGVSASDQLFINNRQLGFSDSTEQYGLKDNDYTTHASFFDYDLDGDLDLYLLNNSFIPVNTLNYANNRKMRARDWPVADFLKGGGDRLMQNQNGRFVDVSESAGIYGSLIGFGLGVTVGDVNNDGYPDIYISNDFYERDYLYLNQKNGSFKEDLENCMPHISLSSMGADMADINNDGFQDIFTTDMLPGDEHRLKTTSSFENFEVHNITTGRGFHHQYMQNTLQVNDANGKFMETAHYSGVEASDWSWSALIFDADNDGFSDIYVSNGIYHDVTDQDFIDFFANDIAQKMALTGKKEQIDAIINKMPSRPIKNKAFKNNGNLKFSDAGDEWGFTQPSFSNGAAYGDLDNDGDLDLVVNNVNAPAFVYRNNARQMQTGHYIGISLKGTAANRFAIGSTIKIFSGNQQWRKDLFPARGFQSSVDYKAIIGTGDEKVDSMIIIWPNRTYSTFYHPAVDSVYKIEQPAHAPLYGDTVSIKDPHLLDSIPHPFKKHVEDEYVDFYAERNIPMLLSREGPRAAVGDVDGNGMEDVYIAGAAGQEGQLYMQTPKGFEQRPQKVFSAFAEFEDGPVLFVDCDNDGDLDLFVGTAGNNRAPSSREMQNRLYFNDGKGNFEIRTGALPLNEGNTSVVIANDWDRDGDKDLFVGSRNISANYGPSPASYLLVNDGKGKFTDVAATDNEDIAHVGLVTSAVWVDLIGDGNEELVIAGEWMAPRVFKFNGKKFTEEKTTMASLHGWWQSIAYADLDKDGDQDLVLGNIGENFYLSPDSANPVKLWVKDFDGNRSIDKIITRTFEGKDKTVFLKRELTDQLPTLKKENLKHADFANKSIEQLFSPDVLKDALVRTFDYPSSCIAINEGGGKFTIRKLPVQVQLSSLNALFITDINSDGYPDIIGGGNNFGFIPQFGRLDASSGHVLLNNGKGGFNWIPRNRTGMEVSGQIRDIKAIQTPSGTRFLVLQNDQFPVLFKSHQTKVLLP